MFQAKKILAKLLQWRPIGGAIRRIYNDLIPFHGIRIHTNAPEISNEVISCLYFNMYESSEIRLISKFIRKDLPVIELGSSIGVVGSLVSKMTSQPIVCVEANPELVPTLDRNLSSNNSSNGWKIINKAVGYDETGFVSFKKSEMSVAGKVQDFNKNDADVLKVPAIHFSQILLQENKAEEDFILICDIEGAEVQILLHDEKSLKNCKQLFIELHEVSYKEHNYSSSQLAIMIQKIGFILTQQDGNAYYFNRA